MKTQHVCRAIVLLSILLSCSNASQLNPRVAPNPNCAVEKFQCASDTTCIPAELVCNGFFDCPDGSDEENPVCGGTLKCAFGQFRCKSPEVCITPTQICDGMNDCADGSDESLPMCDVRVLHFEIIQASRTDQLYPNVSRSKPTVFSKHLENGANVQILDFVWTSRVVVGVIPEENGIGELHHTGQRWAMLRKIASTLYNDARVIAVDQASMNVYVGYERRVIEVINFIGTSRLVILNRPQIGVPSGIVVDPQEGYLYVAETAPSSDIGAILKCRLDGTQCAALLRGVNVGTIAIDPAAGFLYFVSLGQTVRKVNTNGTSISTVYRFPNETDISYIALADKYFFWSDRHSLSYLDRSDSSWSVHSADLYSDLPRRSIFKVPPTFAGVENQCSLGNGGCSHLCFGGSEGRRCACPEGSTLGVNRKTCNGDSYCPDGQFACDKGRCFALSARCNGVTECRDQSDEKGCLKLICYAKDFRCSKDKCLEVDRLCDGIPDCEDGCDESRCDSTMFRCTNKTLAVRKDACLDGCISSVDSFRLHCNRGCSSREFFCGKGDESACIPMAFRCDGHIDCSQGVDERFCETVKRVSVAAVFINGSFIVSSDGASDDGDTSDMHLVVALPVAVVLSIVLIGLIVLTLVLLRNRFRRTSLDCSWKSSCFKRGPFHPSRADDAIFLVADREGSFLDTQPYMYLTARTLDQIASDDKY